MRECDSQGEALSFWRIVEVSADQRGIETG
jgi:hypothetical protein